MPVIPTDQEFLNFLYMHEKDDPWADAFIRIKPNIIRTLADKLDRFVEWGLSSFADRNEDEALIRESMTPQGLFQGRGAEALRLSALQIMGTDGESLRNIPFGILPSRDFNACAVRTPRGGAVILMNSGLLLTLGWFVQCYLAYVTWNTKNPVSREVEQIDFAEALARLAKFNISGDPQWLIPLKEILTLELSSEDDFLVSAFSNFGQIFVVLHEFAHVMLGHLDHCNVKVVTTSSGFNLEAYSKSQIQEFQADRIAYLQMARFVPPIPEATFCVGLVFKFFELCEIAAGSVGTEQGSHPSAAARWVEIRKLAHIESEPSPFTDNLDQAFASIKWR